jgi:hypothetical protein
MTRVPRICTVLDGIIAPREVHFLRFILEAYEGIAVLTTLDPQLGHIRLSIAPGCERDVQHLLEAEQERLQWRPLQT